MLEGDPLPPTAGIVKTKAPRHGHQQRAGGNGAGGMARNMLSPMRTPEHGSWLQPKGNKAASQSCSPAFLAMCKRTDMLLNVRLLAATSSDLSVQNMVHDMRTGSFWQFGEGPHLNWQAPCSTRRWRWQAADERLLSASTPRLLLPPPLLLTAP